MDDEGRPVKPWARLLFLPRQLTETEYRLGLAVVGIAVLIACSIAWPLVPQLLVNLLWGMGSVIAWFGGLFTGGGSPEVVAPVLTPGPTVLPSPFPSPSPFQSPSPSPSPFPR